MEFADDVLRLSAGADDVGRAEEDLPVSFSGDPLTIAFNPTYPTDGLGVVALGASDVWFHDTVVVPRCCGRQVRMTGMSVPQVRFRPL